MKNLAQTAIVVALLTGSAQAQPVTIETTVGERGFPDGVVLRGQATSSVYVALPRNVPITNGRLTIDGQSSTPTLRHGSFGVDLNGRPVDALGLNATSGATPFQRTIALGSERLNGVDALNIRFDADLRTDADSCSDDVDLANSVTVAPTSRIAFDVDIGRVNSVADAIALLPYRALVLLPAQQAVTPEIAATALRVGTLLMGQGREPRFETMRGADAVAVRIAPVQEATAGSPSVRIERDGNRVEIVVDPAADFTAFERMLQVAPGALVGGKVVASQGPVKDQPTEEHFRAFPVLPPAQQIKRFGEWRLNFPLVTSNGRLPESALLKFFIAPDWSGENPILTMYLNDQIVGATRPEPGQGDISVNLPESLLRFSNTLRVTIERAAGKNYCAATDRGQAAQILPGSGLNLGDSKGSGFVGVANAFAVEGLVVLPAGAADANVVGPFLRLSSKILASLGTQARKLSVAFGTQSSPSDTGTIRFEVVGPAGLTLTMADQIAARELRYEVNSPLAVLSADDGGRTLLVQLSDVQDIPQPRALYLGEGSKALVANSGVVWQNTATHEGPSIGTQAWSLWQSISSKAGIAFWLVGLALVSLILSSRAILKAMFDRHRRTDGK